VTDALRDALAQVKDLSRQIPELHAIKLQLETERDGLRTEVSDLQDALRDALARLDAANNNLTQLRADLERRLREKDEEIDSIRSVTQSGTHTTSLLYIIMSHSLIGLSFPFCTDLTFNVRTERKLVSSTGF